MPDMSPEVRMQFQSVLQEAFNKKGLLQLATNRLSFPDFQFAKAINFDASDRDIAFEMVELADSHGCVENLVRAVQAERPNKPEVAALVVAYERSAGRPEEAQQIEIPADIKEAVIRFSVHFELRQRRFRYLNAYKQLHDLLHGLMDYQPEITKVALAVCQEPDEPPDPTLVTEQLQDWVAQSKESAKATEFPKVPSKWIAKFEQAVKNLTRELTRTDVKNIVVADVTRAIEILAQLPADEQKRLNEKLVECAMQLDTNELVELMDTLLDDLGPKGSSGAGTEDLRKAVERFKELCQRLTRLIEDHNLCQEVEGALNDAVGQTEITPQRLARWNDIRSFLRAIAENRPDDVQASRMAKETRLFQEAADVNDLKRAAKVFGRLIDRFNNFFFAMDKSLLEVTRDLIFAVQLLDAILKGIK